MSGWQPIETCPEGVDVLLFYPAEYRRGQRSHSEWVRIGMIGDTPNRKPTLWHVMPARPKNQAPVVRS